MWPVSQLAEGHQALVARLARFEVGAAGKLVAALQLAPELHANTLRIEVLVHLVAFACKGRDIPDGKHLVDWATRHMAESPLARHEDPIEDIFVGCVNCSGGSFRVLNGIAMDMDFWVERLLLQLEEKQDFPPFRTVLKTALALLRLSDALADRIGLERYIEGGGQAAHQHLYAAAPARRRQERFPQCAGECDLRFDLQHARQCGPRNLFLGRSG